jgi:phosphoribosylformylglycinamidine synthase
MKWQGKTIVDISRDFLNSNGAPRSSSALLSSKVLPRRNDCYAKMGNVAKAAADPNGCLSALKQGLESLRSCSRRGLQERFDGSIGAASVLFPWGGSMQGTPECGMAALFPSLEKEIRTASLMSFGYDPFIMEQNPYLGAKGGIREALAKFACMGGNPWKARLSLQEYFERPQTEETWGKPAAALLGALEAQLALGIPAIGGKDSMSGNYRDAQHGINIAVPPTLVAFAAGTAPARSVRSGALSGQNGNVVLLFSQKSFGKEFQGMADGGTQPDEWETFKANMNALAALGEVGCVRSAYPVGPGGVAVSLALMAFGNNAGLETSPAVFSLVTEIDYQGSVLVEVDGDAYRNNPKASEILKYATGWEIAAACIAEPVFRITGNIDGKIKNEEISIEELHRLYEAPLSKVYPQISIRSGEWGVGSRDIYPKAKLVYAIEPRSDVVSTIRSPPLDSFTQSSRTRTPIPYSPLPTPHAPLVVLPVFPGTNCEWDMERAFRKAGARTRLVIFRNRYRDDINDSLRELAQAIGEAQIIALSGGFSAGDEPEGSGKFIANVFRAPVIAGALSAFLDKKDGLMLGICNGFQALIKLGLVAYGSFRAADSSMPTLTFNHVGRHVSRMARTRVMSVKSPWLAREEPCAVHVLPVSHGEGRLVIRNDEAEALFAKGQVPFCYVDAEGNPALAEPDNPNGSDFAIEGLTSPDGRILGKMGHSERYGDYVHINIPGNKKQNIFEAGVGYFA